MTTYNIMSYGADPTGVSDSAPSLRSAVAAATASGDIVVVPAGTYKLSTADGSAPLRWFTRLAVAGVRVEMAPGAILNAEHPGGTGNVWAFNVAASDVTIAGGHLVRFGSWSGANPTGVGVSAANTQVRDLKCEGFFDGIRVEASENTIVDRCTFVNSTRNGLCIISGNRIAVSDCLASGTTGNPGSGFHIEPNSDDPPAVNVTLQRNVAENNVNGIRATGPVATSDDDYFGTQASTSTSLTSISPSVTALDRARQVTITTAGSAGTYNVANPIVITGVVAGVGGVTESLALSKANGGEVVISRSISRTSRVSRSPRKTTPLAS